MIDLDLIEQQCKGAIESGCGHLPVLECGNSVKLMEVISRLRSAESEIDELLSMLRQAEKDAARYKDEIEAAGFDIGNLSSKLERADSVIFEVERVLSERQKNGSFDCDDLLSEAQYYIDNHQGIKE